MCDTMHNNALMMYVFYMIRRYLRKANDTPKYKRTHCDDIMGDIEIEVATWEVKIKKVVISQ